MTPIEYVVLYGAAFLIPLSVTWVLTPLAGAVARRAGLMDRPGARKVHVEPTPYLGGLAVAIGLIAAGLLVGSTAGQAMAIAAGALVMLLLGLLDDFRGVGPFAKLVAEISVAVVLWFAGVRAGIFGIEALDLLLTIGWMVLITNAVNLIDNMDGLATGVVVIAGVAYFAIAAAEGDYLVSMLGAALAGAGAGFLRHNFPPARIFLGDAGSLLLGFFVASLALLLDLPTADDALRIGVHVLILGVPVADTILVILSRLRAGRPVMLGGMDHSSHRLAALGLGSRGVALLLYGAQAVCSTIAVAAVIVPEFAVRMTLAFAAVALAVAVVVVVLRSMPPSKAAGDVPDDPRRVGRGDGVRP